MNNLLRNMIEVEDMAVFIDNVMIETKMKEEHDKIIEEVLRRMVE